MASADTFVRPYLKWAGGKRQLLPEIKKYLPPDIGRYTYIEPFLGAGAVFFHIQPRQAVVNDFNAQLILTYRIIKEHVDALVDILNCHHTHHSKEYFYEIRSQDRDPALFSQLTDIEKAARLIYLNKTCYNGLYRVNSQGLFNVPYGRYKNPAICEAAVLRAIHHYLNNNRIDILTGDFETALQRADENSFVYFDPPYHSPDRSNFTGYQANGFGERDQIRLRDAFLQLTNNGVKCLLSNSDTQFIRDLYENNNCHIHPVLAKRAINSNSLGRGSVSELLITNWVQ